MNKPTKPWDKQKLDEEIKKLAQGAKDAGDITDDMAFDIAESWEKDNPDAIVAISKYYRVRDIRGWIANKIV
jgi:hypothetical protein